MILQTDGQTEIYYRHHNSQHQDHYVHTKYMQASNA